MAEFHEAETVPARVESPTVRQGGHGVSQFRVIGILQGPGIFVGFCEMTGSGFGATRGNFGGR